MLDPVEAQSTPSFHFDRAFQVGGVRHHGRFGRVVAGLVHDHVRGDLGGDAEQDFRTLTLTSRGDLRVPTDALTWAFGWELRGELAWLKSNPAGDLGVLVASETPSLAWPDPIDFTGLRGHAATYGELHVRTGGLRLIPGIRASVDSMGGEPMIEPRLSARWRVLDETELKATAGLYQQRADTAVLVAQPELPTTRAWEVATGIEQTIAHRVELGLDGYHKWLYDPLTTGLDGAPTTAPLGRSFGLELTSRYRIRETFFLWGWFALSRSLLVDEQGRELPSVADQPISGGVVASWNIIDPLNVAVRYRIASGLPWTPVDDSLYDATTDTWAPVLAQTNSERYPLYQKVDLHASYTFRMRRWSLALSTDIWIVPQASAQLYPTWNYDFSEQGWVYGPTVVPLLGARATF